MDKPLPFCSKSTGSSIQQSSNGLLDFKFPFFSLPVELQRKICCCFCPHCTEASSFTIIYSSGGLALLSLKALSETCRDLRALAQPIMYHCLDTRAHHLLFRTLISRPDLAAGAFVFPRYDTTTAVSNTWVTKPDFGYIEQVARDSGINDVQDPHYKNPFKFLYGDDEDHHDRLKRLALAAFRSLITTIYIALLPNLRLLCIDLNDGHTFRTTNDQHITLYPYLPSWIAENPERLYAIKTVVFNHAIHHLPHNLGLDRLYFLFQYIPNVERIIFDFTRRYEPPEYTDFPSTDERPEISWPALPHIKEIYFHPCERWTNSVPYTGIKNLIGATTSLQKFVFRTSWQSSWRSLHNFEFSLVSLLDALLPVSASLKHLALYCSYSELPKISPDALLPAGGLVGTTLKQMSLTNLVLDEGLFCTHWLYPDSDDDSCLVNILSDTVQYLTIRLHNKYAAVADIMRIGREVTMGRFPQIRHIEVQVLNDSRDRFAWYDAYNELSNLSSDDVLYKVPLYEWKSTIQNFVKGIEPSISGAFQSTRVTYKIVYTEEQLYPFTSTTGI